MNDVQSFQHVEDTKVKMTRSTIIRYFALCIHMILIILLFLLTFFLSPSLTMISIQAFATFGMLVYVPATIGLTARLKKTKWDRAWGEVVYLGYQGGLWLANAITAGIVGGPSYCSQRLYESGRTTPGAKKYPYEPIGSIQSLCNAMSVNIALSSIHVFCLIIWIYWIYKIITKLSLSKSSIEQKEKNLWNVSVGELMRRDIRYKENGKEKRNEEGVITPFVHPQNDSNLSVTHTQSNTQPVIQPTIEPERDIGPYIPPPPYQNSYDIPSTSPPTESNTNTSPTETNSTYPIRSQTLESNGYSSNTSYLPELSLGSSDLSPTSPSSTPNANENRPDGSGRRTSLRRVMDEKQDSKDVIRRALGG